MSVAAVAFENLHPSHPERVALTLADPPITLIVSALDPDLELLRRSAHALDCRLKIVDQSDNTIPPTSVLDLAGGFITL